MSLVCSVGDSLSGFAYLNATCSASFAPKHFPAASTFGNHTEVLGISDLLFVLT